MKRTIAIFAAFLLITSCCLGQSLTAPVKPFVNPSTLLVARINVAGIDLNAVDRWSGELTGQVAPAEKREEISGQVRPGLDWAKEFSQKFTKAGGKTVWAVLSLEDLNHPNPFFLVVPVEAGADVQGLKAAVSVRNAVVEQVGSVLVVAWDQETAARLKAEKGEERPELLKAVEAADGSADLIVGAAASGDAKKVLESMVPELPDKKPATPITRDLAWASVWVKAWSRTGRIVFRTSDPQRLQDALVSLLPKERAKDPLPATLGGLLKQSKVEKDELVIELRPDGSTQLAARTAEGVAKVREKARRIQSINNIKQLMLGLIIAANDDKGGQYPQRLEDALKGIDGGEKTLVNPREPGEKVGYVYVRPAEGLRADSERLVIYEKFTKWDGVAVGFADGHVEFVVDRATFQKLLDTAMGKKSS